MFKAFPPEVSLGSLDGFWCVSLTEEHKAESRASWGTTDVVMSVVVLMLIAGAYLYFSG